MDNDSQGGSLELISEEVRSEDWQDRHRVVGSLHNGGFAHGNNFAIRPALASEDKPNYVCLLNSGAFRDVGYPAEIVDSLDSHATAGIAGATYMGRMPLRMGQVASPPISDEPRTPLR